MVQNTSSGPGNVGIEVLQYGSGQTYAAASTATKTRSAARASGSSPLGQRRQRRLPRRLHHQPSTYLTGNTSATQDNSTNYSIQGSGDR